MNVKADDDDLMMMMMSVGGNPAIWLNRIFDEIADVTDLIEVSLDRWRVGCPSYAIVRIDRWVWLAHGPQICWFSPFFSVSTLYGVCIEGV